MNNFLRLLLPAYEKFLCWRNGHVWYESTLGGFQLCLTCGRKRPEDGWGHLR